MVHDEEMQMVFVITHLGIQLLPWRCFSDSRNAHPAFFEDCESWSVVCRLSVTGAKALMWSERAALYLAYPFYLFADARTVRLKRFLFIEKFVL